MKNTNQRTSPEDKDLLISRPLLEIANKYRRLVKLEFPTDDELDEIDHILELAIYDTELDNLINEIDLDIASNIVTPSIALELEPTSGSEALSVFHFSGHRNYQALDDKTTHNSLRQFSCVEHYSPNQAQNNYASAKDLLGATFSFFCSSKAKLAIGGFSVLLIGLVSHCHQLIPPNAFSKTSLIQAISTTDNSAKEPQSNISASINNVEKQSNSLNNYGRDDKEFKRDKHETLSWGASSISTANYKYEESKQVTDKFTNPEAKNTYVDLNQLEMSDTSQPSQKIVVRQKAQKIQLKAESKQKEAESKQRNAEHQQLIAELDNHKDLARDWSIRAKKYLEESQQWLYIAKDSVAIATEQ